MINKLKLLYGLTESQMMQVYYEYERYMQLDNIQRLMRQRLEVVGTIDIDKTMQNIDWDYIYDEFDSSQFDDVYEEYDNIAKCCIMDYIENFKDEIKMEE